MGRISKRCAPVLCALILFLLAGCKSGSGADAISDTISGSAPDASDASASSTVSGSASAAVSDGALMVQDVTGSDYDLAATPWGSKYPFMVEHYRELIHAAQAGGIAQREEELCTGWSKTVLPDTCVTPLGTAVISCLRFDADGNPDPDGPRLRTTVRSAALSTTAELLTDTLPKDGTQDYLTVALTVENAGSEDVEFYLNSLHPWVVVDGEFADTVAVSEMVSASGTSGPHDGHSFFRCTLAPGQSQEYTAVFYADRRVEMADIFLQINYLGLYEQPAPTENPLVFTQAGTFCALR